MMLPVSNILRCQRLTQNPVRLLIVRNLRKEPIEVSWKKPGIGWTKLNFDGSCKGRTGKGSIGGVFRNHEAEFLLGYAESIGDRTTSTVAELAALRRGLELAVEEGWDHVWLEGDSKALVEIIAAGRRNVVRCLEAQRHVGEIKQMMALKNCILSHVYREGNRAADKFAKMAHRLEEPRIWRHDPPCEVMDILHEDAEDKVFRLRR